MCSQYPGFSGVWPAARPLEMARADGMSSAELAVSVGGVLLGGDHNGTFEITLIKEVI